jgi:FixJ family two-component response regulator
MAARVYLIDDDPGVLKALTRLLRSAGLQPIPFGCPLEFLATCDPALRGCLVLDVAMPGLDGMRMQQALAAAGCTLPIIFLTGHGDIPMSVQAMKRGAVDFLTKPVDEASLLAAVREALARDAMEGRKAAERSALRDRLASLTPREAEVLTHVVAGKLNKQIAVELGTAEKTIKVHRARVMEKMQAQSLADLVRMTERAK